MENIEFSEAVDAFLANTANSWQQFIVEDYCHYWRYNCDISEIYEDAKAKGISDRVFQLIARMWDSAKP
ncbi:MAG: hypothetical protein ABWY16_10855 [Pedobacter sp.]|uniref:hypothetical protein n=1 Tax=Pedobacter sp. TaxID=1411316 RepID=UPI003394A371